MLIKGKAEFQPQAQRHSLKKKKKYRKIFTEWSHPLTPTHLHTSLLLLQECIRAHRTQPVNPNQIWIQYSFSCFSSQCKSPSHCACVSLCMNTLSLTGQLTCVSVWFFTTIYVNRLSHSFLHNIHLIWFNTHVHFTIFTSLFLIWFVNFFQLTFVS